jgi:medium-chain acyl-[acyl-carrier-protein] hydrolase
VRLSQDRGFQIVGGRNLKKAIAVGSWIVVPTPNPQARLRLFCFPYGGAGAHLFRSWPVGLPTDIELCAVQLPGRENRLREEPYTEVSRAVSALAEALAPHFDLPFAFFGHSLGAFLAFELTRQLRRHHRLGPGALLVSGQRAPQLPDRFPPLYQLPDDEFLSEVHRRYDAIPAVVRHSADLMALLLPQLRADFTMNDTYACEDDRKLDCPISCFGGEGDPETTAEELNAWREQTHGEFKLRPMPGGHFFIRSEQELFLRTLSEDLNRLVPTNATAEQLSGVEIR